LDVLDYLGILIVDLLDNLKWSMTLAVDFEDFLSILKRRAFFLDLHAIVSSFGTFDMELDVAIWLVTLNYSSYVDTFLAADYTTMVEFGKIKLIHLDWLPWSDYWTRHPHGTTMMSPMVQSVSNWRRTTFEQGLVPLQKVTIVLRNGVVCLLMLIEIELKFVFLVLDQPLRISKLRNRFITFIMSYSNVVHDLQVIIEDCPFVQNFSRD